MATTMRELLVTLAKAIDDGNNNLSPWRTSITNALNRRELRGDKEKCNQIEEQLDKLRDLKDRFNRFEDLMSKCLEDPHNYLEDLKTMAQDTMTWLTTKVAHAVSVVKVANEVAMKYHFVFPKRTAGCKTLLEDAALKLLSQPANATIDYKALDDQLAEHHNHVERVRKSAPTASTSQNRVPRHVTSEDLPKGFVSSATSSLVGPASAGQSQKLPRERERSSLKRRRSVQGLDPETSAEVTIQSNPDLQAQRQRTKKSKPGQAPSHAAGLMAFSKPVNQPPGQKSAYVQGTSYSPWNSNLATMPTSFFNPAHQSPHLASLYHGTVHHPAAGPGQLDQGYQGYAANFPSSGVPAHQTSANHGIPFPPRGLRQDRSYVPPSSSMRDPVYPPGQLPAARVPVYPGYGDTAAVPERGLAAPFPPHQAALPNATPARPASMGVGMNQCHCTLCGNIFQPGHVCYR